MKNTHKLMEKMRGQIRVREIKNLHARKKELGDKNIRKSVDIK
jgi:hypothetical protein